MKKLILFTIAIFAVSLSAIAQCTRVSITSQPQNKTVNVGSTATFSVSVSGTSPFLYFWYKNGVQISGANSSSYTTPSLTSSDNGNYYYCIITNCSSTYQAVSNNAYLTVNNPCTRVSITSQPQNKTANIGGTATFSVSVSGTSPFLYFWYKNGVQISGANSSSYTTPTLTAADNGNYYYCIITNCSSTYQAVSNNAYLTVNCVSVSITSQPQNQTVNVGSTATFSVSVSGTSPFLYFWYKNGVQISGANSSSYTTSTLTAADNGNYYYCIITNCSSTHQAVSNNAYLTVNCTSPTVTTQPQSQTVNVGSTATFSVAVSGTPPFLYFWYKNGSFISGATSSSYTTPTLTASDNGNVYYCLINNCNNQNQAQSNTATLTVNSNSTHLTIVRINDPSLSNLSIISAADAASAMAAFDYAAAQISALYSDPITVTITLAADYGNGTLGKSNYVGGGYYYSYSQLRTSLIADEQTSDDAVAVSTLPVSDPIGANSYNTSKAQAKALGLTSNDATNDGIFTFGAEQPYTFDPQHRVVTGKFDFIGVAMHEITEIMGRQYGLSNITVGSGNYMLYDLFRYSGSGTRGLSTGSGIYFSIDGGTTNLKTYNNMDAFGGDPMDWASGSNDAFNAFSYLGVLNDLTPVDMQVMDAIGYNRINITSITSFNPTSAASGTTITITGNNFDGVSAVSFGGTPAASFSFVSSTTISAVVGSGSSGDVSVTTPGGIVSKSGFTYLAKPTISFFNPTSAGAGTTVDITGTNFTSDATVTFGGTAATSVTFNSSTNISAVVGSGSSGNVTVTTPGGTANKSGFTYLAKPTISFFNPTSARTGTTVNITGTNFTTDATVTFGSTAASSVTFNSSTSLSAVVGSGSSGDVSVTTSGGTAYKSGFTYLAAPTISYFAPTNATTGTSVDITGTNFTTDATVTFGGTAASSVTFNSSTSLSAVVGSGSSGDVSVTTQGGTASKAGFTYINSTTLPFITNYSPSSGPVGTTVTIIGGGFSSISSSNIVFFGAVRAIVKSATSTTLTAKVPKGASYNPISVTSNNLTAYSIKPFTVTFSDGGNAFTATSFASRVSYATGLEPEGLANGDIDGDGKPDLIVINNASNTVSVFRNTSSAGIIAFATKVDFATEDIPNSLAVADVDGDGKLDLVLDNLGSNNVSVLRNTSSAGSVSFAPRVSYATGSGPQGVATGDIDGDDKPDIVTCNTESNTISIFRNISTPGNISFTSNQDFTTGTWPRGVAIADLDADNKVDVIVANRNSGTISILRNISSSGNISLAPKIDYVSGTDAVGVVLADFDGGSLIDIAVANKKSNTISVFRNTSTIGSISFAAKTDYTTGAYPISAAASDMDGDGKPDLAVANYTSGNISVFRNTSTEGTIAFEAKFDYASGNAPWNISIGDVNVDGKPDMIVSNTTDNTVSILRNKNKKTAFVASASSSSDVAKHFSLYPNPATNKIILTSAVSGVAEIKLMNVNQKLIKTYKVNFIKGGNQEIPITELAGGVYFIQVKIEDILENLKFVKAQ